MRFFLILNMILLLFIPTAIAEQLTRFAPRPAPTPVCNYVANLHAALSTDGELSGMTKIDDYHVLNLYRADDGRWALLLVNVQGVACLLQNGTTWQDEPASKVMKPKS